MSSKLLKYFSEVNGMAMRYADCVRNSIGDLCL